MFAKPFNMILVYIVTVCNVAILSCPLIAVLLPFVARKNLVFGTDDSFLQHLKIAIFLVLFLVSFLMICYLLLDFLIGYSLFSSLKNCKRYETIKEYDFLTKIFEQVKEKFGEKNVKLYIKDSAEINAFAVASISRKTIVLTKGLIVHYLQNSDNSKEFYYSLRSIMGHEMSHLINRDFLPTYLIIANQKATNFVSFLLNIIFRAIITVGDFLPFLGRGFANITYQIYSILTFIFGFFNRFIVYNIYEFLRKFVSRSIEYRCDYQSARAFGGKNMAFALNFLSESGYFTLFSTHPRTKSRINKVKNVEISSKTIKAGFFEVMAGNISLLLLVVICMFFAKQAQIDELILSYIRNHEVIYQKLRNLWYLVRGYF